MAPLTVVSTMLGLLITMSSAMPKPTEKPLLRPREIFSADLAHLTCQTNTATVTIYVEPQPPGTSTFWASQVTTTSTIDCKGCNEIYSTTPRHFVSRYDATYKETRTPTTTTKYACKATPPPNVPWAAQVPAPAQSGSSSSGSSANPAQPSGNSNASGSGASGAVAAVQPNQRAAKAQPVPQAQAQAQPAKPAQPPQPPHAAQPAQPASGVHVNGAGLRESTNPWDLLDPPLNRPEAFGKDFPLTAV